MQVIQIDQAWLTAGRLEKTTAAARLKLVLPAQPMRFFKHGWQSWTLATWLDPAEPPVPIWAAEFRAKDEDPPYAFAKNHNSAWVAAIEVRHGLILLLGALDLSGRIELDNLYLHGFYESGEGDWLIALGNEDEVFNRYTTLLEERYGKTKIASAPRVWCSWYSLYKWINEPTLRHALAGLDNLPFDVFQVDDGWQVTHGDWEANRKFPAGMADLASRINATGRSAGIWLAPFMVTRNSTLIDRHPDWLLRGTDGRPVPVGITWEGNPYALNSSHPAVLDWLDALIRKVRAWGFNYLKLDFLYAGALPGNYSKDMPRELSYRGAMQVIRSAAGDAYLLACGAPIIPTLGLADGLRIGPDVAPFWINKPLTIWLNNPNDTGSQNAVRTSLHRQWLKPLIHTDPDVSFFRTRFNRLKVQENQYLADLGSISDFKATSDLPQWLTPFQRTRLKQFLETKSIVRRLGRYLYDIDGRQVDFSPEIPFRTGAKVPIWFARNLGLLKIILIQVLPAVWESRRHMRSVVLTVISFLQTIHLPWLP